MSDWTIQGESGKALGAASVDLELTQFSGVQITHTNQGTDTCSFFVRCDDPTVDPTYLPEYNQAISLWKSGVRQFVGYVGKPKFILQGGIFGWQVEAQNGWQELDRVPLSTSDAEYARAQGPMTATVQDIINKAIAGGARIALGSVATMFDIPPISFRGTSCGAALTELLKICADAVAYLDYSVVGNPALTIVRRGSMTAKTITFGTDEIVEPFSCTPIPGVTPTKLTVAYATRNANGVVTETVQTAGSGTDAQAVILTEPNLAAFQTLATAEQVAMQTTTTANAAFAIARSPDLSKIVGLPAALATGSYTRPEGGTYTTKGSITVPGDSPAFSGFTAPNTNALLAGEMKDYMTSKLGITQGVGTFSGHLWWRYSLEDGSGGIAAPSWAAPLISAGADILSGWWTAGTSGANTQSNPNTWTAHYLRLYVEFEAVAISTAFATLTNLRDPGNYGTLAPPASLAADLLAAQNFVPYEGAFNLSPWHTPDHLLSKKVSFGGLTARLSSIGALLQSETLDVETGSKSLVLGLAARQGNSALGRLRKLGG
jgi:hypothetical protein